MRCRASAGEQWTRASAWRRNRGRGRGLGYAAAAASACCSAVWCWEAARLCRHASTAATALLSDWRTMRDLGSSLAYLAAVSISLALRVWYCSRWAFAAAMNSNPSFSPFATASAASFAASPYLLSPTSTSTRWAVSRVGGGWGIFSPGGFLLRGRLGRRRLICCAHPGSPSQPSSASLAFLSRRLLAALLPTMVPSPFHCSHCCFAAASVTMMHDGCRDSPSSTPCLFRVASSTNFSCNSTPTFRNLAVRRAKSLACRYFLRDPSAISTSPTVPAVHTMPSPSLAALLPSSSCPSEAPSNPFPSSPPLSSIPTGSSCSVPSSICVCSSCTSSAAGASSGVSPPSTFFVSSPHGESALQLAVPFLMQLGTTSTGSTSRLTQRGFENSSTFLSKKGRSSLRGSSGFEGGSMQPFHRSSPCRSSASHVSTPDLARGSRTALRKSTAIPATTFACASTIRARCVASRLERLCCRWRARTFPCRRSLRRLALTCSRSDVGNDISFGEPTAPEATCFTGIPHPPPLPPPNEVQRL
eukprot:Sspe_Gene.42500::Locus_20632_Transcript_1_1_Confidence_1.000_Length_2420::g.42500::m.42500